MNRNTRSTLVALLAIGAGMWVPFLAAKADASMLPPNPPDADVTIIVAPIAEVSGMRADPVPGVLWEDVCSLMDCSLEREFLLTEIGLCVASAAVGIGGLIKLVRATRRLMKASKKAKEAKAKGQAIIGGAIMVIGGFAADFFCLGIYDAWQDFRRCQEDATVQMDGAGLEDSADLDACYDEMIWLLDDIEAELENHNYDPDDITPRDIGRRGGIG